MLKELDFRAAFESVVRYDVSTCSDSPVVKRRRGSTLWSSLGKLVTAVLRDVGETAHRALARHRQRRRARAIYDTLRQLNDHTLRDIGFERCEIASVAAGVSELADHARERTPSEPRDGPM